MNLEGSDDALISCHQNYYALYEDDFINKIELNIFDKMSDSSDSEEQHSLDKVNYTRNDRKFEEIIREKSYINNYQHESSYNDEIKKNVFEVFGNISNQPTDDNEEKPKAWNGIIDEKNQKIGYQNEKEKKNNLNKAMNNQKSIKEKNNYNMVFMQKKRKDEKVFYITKSNKKTNYGRKIREDPIKGKHNKLKGDNIINKIKGYVFNYYIRDIIKKNSFRAIDLIKLTHGFIEDLSKDKNEILFTKKIKDILSEEEITPKNKNFDRYENRLILEKLYKRKEKEKKVIKILELTFREILIIFRRNFNCEKDKEALEIIKEKIEGLDLLENNNYKDIGYFINEIKKKEEENNNLLKDTEDDEDESENYIEKIKYFCCNYEEWFNAKKGRKSKKLK